jgi:hypothetical protein
VIVLYLRLQCQFHLLPAILDKQFPKPFYRGQVRSFKRRPGKRDTKEGDMRVKNKRWIINDFWQGKLLLSASQRLAQGSFID